MDGKRIPYRIESEHLTLAAWELADVQPLYALVKANQAYLSNWMPWARDEITLDGYFDFVRDRRAAFDKGEDYVYGLTLPDGTLAGSAGLHGRCGAGGMEVGYWIAEEHTNQGLATESAALLSRVALQHLAVARVELRVQPGNDASIRVAEKLGFRHEGLLRNRLEIEDGWFDLESFTLVQGEQVPAPYDARTLRLYDGLGRPLSQD
ncbi:MAG: GNAT family protein [Planctomycetota bacterium]|nr:GNAT family protein [Planctomycetota bacterium]